MSACDLNCTGAVRIQSSLYVNLGGGCWYHRFQDRPKLEKITSLKFMIAYQNPASAPDFPEEISGGAKGIISGPVIAEQ